MCEPLDYTMILIAVYCQIHWIVLRRVIYERKFCCLVIQVCVYSAKAKCGSESKSPASSFSSSLILSSLPNMYVPLKHSFKELFKEFNSNSLTGPTHQFFVVNKIIAEKILPTFSWGGACYLRILLWISSSPLFSSTLVMTNTHFSSKVFTVLLAEEPWTSAPDSHPFVALTPTFSATISALRCPLIWGHSARPVSWPKFL